MLETIHQIEQAILRFFISIHHPILDKIMIFITNLDNYGQIWIVLGLILLLFKKYRKVGVTVLISLVIMLLLNDLFLKHMIRRIRPYEGLGVELLIPIPKDFSFPSGHAASSFSAAFALFKYYKRFAFLYFGLATLISISRLYLTVHYLSDILGGVLIGYICALIGIWIVEKLYAKFRPNYKIS